MASKGMVATVLAMFQEAFPTRPVSATTAEVWFGIMAETSDEQLRDAALRLARDPARTFFPTTGEVFAAIAKDNPPVDSLTMLHRIERLGYYDAHLGWVYPTYEMILNAFGEDVAKAYRLAGAEKVYAPSERDGSSISRDIARRRFEEAMQEAQKATPTRLLLPAPKELSPPLEVEQPRERIPRHRTAGDPTPLAAMIDRVISKATVDPGSA